MIYRLVVELTHDWKSITQWILWHEWMTPMDMDHELSVPVLVHKSMVLDLTLQI